MKVRKNVYEKHIHCKKKTQKLQTEIKNKTEITEINNKKLNLMNGTWIDEFRKWM